MARCGQPRGARRIIEEQVGIILWSSGDHHLGRDQQTRDRGGVLQRETHHLGRIDDPGIDQVHILQRLRVDAVVGISLVDQLADHDRPVDAGIEHDLADRLLQGAPDDNTDADALVAVGRLELVEDAVALAVCSGWRKGRMIEPVASAMVRV
jgi:hypothetical protein